MKKAKLIFADITSISGIASAVAALASSSMFLVAGEVAATLITFVFAIPVFLAVFLLLGFVYAMVSRVSNAPALRWILLPVLGAAAGFMLPFAIGLIVGLFPYTGAAGGLAGGACFAWYWGYVERYREKHPGRSSDPWFATPAWMTSSKKEAA